MSAQAQKEKEQPKPVTGKCKRGHPGPVGCNCGDCLMDHMEIAPFEKRP